MSAKGRISLVEFREVYIVEGVYVAVKSVVVVVCCNVSYYNIKRQIGGYVLCAY